MTRWVSESEGNGARNATASREKASASCRHRAWVPVSTGMVIAGYPLYAGAVICSSASPDEDPPQPASRRTHRSNAAEDPRILTRVNVRVHLPADEGAPR